MSQAQQSPLKLDMWKPIPGTGEGPTIAQRLAPRGRLSKVRIDELDGIRGIAILSVLAYHLLSYSQQLLTQNHAINWSGLARLVELSTWPGFLGVDIFFVLSGFLITGILLDTKEDSSFLRNFYARRAVRILPLYFAVLLVIACCYANVGRYIVMSVFFLANLVPFSGIQALAPLWSLSVEEHFYLIWPWIVKDAGRRKLAAVALTICVLEPIVRVAGAPIWGDGYFYSWTRFDGLACGALIACFARSSKATIKTALNLSRICIGGALLVLLAGMPFGLLSRQNLVGVAFQYAPAQLFSMAMILASLAVPGSRLTGILRNRVLRLFGDLSYCLYLVHMLVMDGYDAVFGRMAPLQLSPFSALLLRAVTVLAFSVGIALLSRRFLEIPALRWKRYLERKPELVLSVAN